jgi:hypothetical protein
MPFYKVLKSLCATATVGYLSILLPACYHDKDPAAKPVSLTLSPSIAVITAGKSLRLDAQAKRVDGMVDSYNALVTWRSSDPSIADVSNEPATAGVVTAYKTGSVKISVEDIDWGLQAEAAVTVGDAKIESIEISIANISEALAGIVEDIEMDEEEERTVRTVKSYLKSQIDYLEDVGREAGRKEAQKLEKILGYIKEKEEKLKDTKRVLKEKERELESKIDSKKKSFTETEARELILKKFIDGIRFQLERYLSAEEKKIVSVLSRRWNKYQVPLSIIESDRDKSAKKLFKFLSELGYKK